MDKRPPYLHRTVTRHGSIAWYTWKRPGPKIRIKYEYGTPEFWAAYDAALKANYRPRKPASKPGSVSATIAEYLASPAWNSLSDATKRQRGNILRRLEDNIGRLDATAVDSAMIKQQRDNLKPGTAKAFVQTLKGLYGWAVETERVPIDPTIGIKSPVPKTDGYHVWTENELASYKARWPLGTRERLWLEVLANTGFRRSDIVKLKLSEIRDGVISIRTGKTGTKVEIPVMPDLQAALDAGPVGSVYVIENAIGEPFTPGAFSFVFYVACRKAGVNGSAHGLRKMLATKLAEDSATVLELNSVFGWVGSAMALKYTAKADRSRLARQAFERVRTGKNKD